MQVSILGGGLAGISSAYHLNDNLEVSVYEKSEITGGLLRTDEKKGYFFDFGPHIYFHKDPYFLEIFKKSVNLVGYEERIAKAAQWSFKKLIEYPYSLHLMGLPESVVAECVSDFISCQVEIAKGFSPSPKNYDEYCREYYGNGLNRHFMQKYSKKMWTIPPTEIDIDWVGKAVKMPDFREVIRGSIEKRSLSAHFIQEFFYPTRMGAQALINGLERMCSKNKIINTKKEVCEINLQSKNILFKDGSSTNYELIISSIPLPELKKIIVNLPKKIIDAIDKLNKLSVLLLNIGGKFIKNNPYHWIYFDQDDALFRRIHYPSKLSDYMAPKGMQSIQMEISYSKFDPLKKSPDIILEKCCNQLYENGFLSSRGVPELSFTRQIDYAYAIMDKNRKKNVPIIREFLHKNGFLTCGRFGEWDYIWTDKVLHSGKSAAEKVNSFFS